MATRRFTSRHMVALVLLIGLGVAGNYFSVPFFFGIDFLFGSIATMIIIRLYGTGWGVLSALVISAYTYTLWGHSLALATFAIEALTVGLLAQRWKATSLLLLDGAFWVCIGMPLVWFGYQNLLVVDQAGTVLIMLKQSVNGIFNALVAMLAVTHLPLRRWLLGEEQSTRISVGEALFNLLVAFLLLPALVSILLVGRHEVAAIDSEVETLLSSQSQQAIDAMRQWRDRNQRAVIGLARAAAEAEMIATESLDSQLWLYLTASPDILHLSVIAHDGTVVASANQAITDPDTALIPRTPRPGSNIWAAQLTPELPVLLISEPVIREGRWIGTVQGVLDLHHARIQLRDATSPFPLDLTMLDQTGKVFATSRADLPLLEPFDRAAGGRLSWIDKRRYRRFPAETTAAVMRWRDSREVLEAPVPGSGRWTMVAEVSMAPFRSRLYAVYNDNLLIILVLSIVTLILSATLSRLVTRPLLQLTAITRYLPQRLQGGVAVLWPTSLVLEIDALATDIQRMATALRQQFDEIEQEARQQRALLSAAMEATDLPVLITDQHERIVYVNPPFLQEYGYAPDEVLGRRPTFLRSPSSNRRAVQRMREAVRRGQPIALDLVNLRKDGTPVDTELVLSPFRSPDGHLTHYVGIYRDISDRKAVERVKSQFALSLAHELRTPLTAIRGSLGLLATQTAHSTDPRTSRLLQIATSNTERLVTLLTEILEFEGVEAGRVEMHPETLSAGDLVELAAAPMRPKFEQAQVSLGVEVPPLPVRADPGRVAQALTHILQHALDSSERGAEVRVTAVAVAGEVLFAVEDHGPGIPPNQIEHLFQAFDQGRLCSACLGLTLARAVIHRLDGRLWIESAVGQGSTFFFTLPSSTTPEVCTGGTLLAFADPDVAASVGELLAPAGFELTQVQNESAAWDALSAREYDTLLLDPLAPGALEFLQELRQSLRFVDLPVVVMGQAEEGTDRSLLQADPEDEVRFKEVVRVACSRTA